MKLRDLLADVELAPGANGLPREDREIHEVREDSRQVSAGDLFVAVTGAQVDARTLVPDALSRGATAVVAQIGGPDDEGLRAAVQAHGASLITVPDARRALGVIAANRYGATRAMALVALTGTNGKTTTTHIVEAMLAAAGRNAGMIGTVANRFAGDRQEATLTTPGALALHELLARWRAAGCTDVVLEATSQALDQGRLAGCRFRAAGLTNVTQDHLDWHGTMDAYFLAKAILFRELLARGGVAVLPVDREEGRRMAAHVRGETLSVSSTIGVRADVSVRAAQLDGTGISATLSTPAGPVELVSPLVGEFNLQNLTLATGMAVALGLPTDAVVRGAATLAGVPGRLERVDNQHGVLCVVDYAHTPDALERSIGALRPLCTGKVIVVFGCGGDRDRGKRPLMGELAARMADQCIVTSDNPRTEDPAAIAEMILVGVRQVGRPQRTPDAIAAGMPGTCAELDRRAAIGLAIASAGPGDGVLIAGKGHEDYQIIGTTKSRFDDREEARAAFARKAPRHTEAGGG